MINSKKFLALIFIMFSMLITGCNSGSGEAPPVDTSSYNQSDLDYDPSAPLQFRKISSSSMEKYDEQWVTLTVFNNTDEEVSASNSFAGANNSAEIFSTTKNLLLPEKIDGSKIWEWYGLIVEENNFNVRGLTIAPKQSGVMLVIVNRGIYLNEKLELRIKFNGSQSNTVYPLKQGLI